VAEEKGDTALSRQADELEQQATTLYNARVSALGLKASLGQPKTKAPLPDSTSDIRIDEPVTPRAAADRLIAPSNPVPSASTAEVQEVK
jgi:hypothetical protein